MMKEEMLQRINICFEGLIATIGERPGRIRSETHLSSLIGRRPSVQHTYSPYSDCAMPLRDQVFPFAAFLLETDLEALYLVHGSI